MTFKYLSWDSNFFKNKTGCLIVNASDTIEEVKDEVKNKIRVEEYDLLYIFCPEDYYIENVNYKLVDRKVVFSRELLNKLSSAHIIDYPKEEPDDDLLNLAYLSGQYSRFKHDKNFPSQTFYKLYKNWLIGSLKGTLADRTFISTANNVLAGFATVKVDDGTGVIQLIAVSDQMQKSGIGRNLVNKVNNYLLDKGIYKLEVATQLQNLNACRFYESNGFKTKSITNIYHCWKTFFKI
jgi:dTDP-4-amino-4,6-dideoxy-D-galactose acyltransferase